ncbi:MAG TPA: efflux RND transporter periplasmic adaptor subunit [Aliidongia sp.]|nr:efflux RND transporter periplasmic adaptor subunit [Aliidongia sp.]
MEQGSTITGLSPPTEPVAPPLGRSDPRLPPVAPVVKARRRGWRWALAALIAVGIAIAAWQWPAAWQPWLGLSAPTTTLIVSGNIEAHESVVGFKTVQSRIVELPFDEGKSVKAGALIARVEDADYRQQVAIAQAALEVQRRQLDMSQQNLVASQKTILSDQADLVMKKLDYDRYQSLWKSGYSPTQQRDQAATGVKQSQAALERDQALELAAERSIELAKANIHSAEEAVAMADITLGYTTLVAPFDGVILVREAELGEIAVPGTPVVTLADLDHIWLRAYINETDISRVRLGAAAAVTTDTYPGKNYRGRISFISSSAEFTPKSVETHAERVTLVYRIKIDLDNPTHELVPGMPADAAIDLPAP